MSASTPRTSQDRGRWAEDLAAEHLARGGLQTVQRNFRCKWGEIDLIMQDRHVIVFVEVRYRRQNRFGSPAESVGYRKQQKLIATAEHYLQTREELSNSPCRFDVVSISPDEVSWIKDAFHA